MSKVEVGFHIDGDFWEPHQITRVEECGYDILTTGEHIIFFRPILDVVTVLAYAAAATKRIKLLPSTFILPLRHPTIVTKELTSLDVLSKGRLIASFGIGGDYPPEFEACGIPIKERGRRANEALDIIRQYWTGETFSYEGRIFKLDNVQMSPTPIQKNGPPIWICGRSDPAMKRAVKYGDGWQPYMYTADQFAESVVKIKEFASEENRELPADFAYTCFMYVSMHDDVETARNLAIEQLSYRFNIPFEKIVDKYCAYGPADKIIEELGAYVEAGANRLIVALVMPEQDRIDHVEKFANEILPSLQAMSTS